MRIFLRNRTAAIFHHQPPSQRRSRTYRWSSASDELIGWKYSHKCTSVAKNCRSDVGRCTDYFSSIVRRCNICTFMHICLDVEQNGQCAGLLLSSMLIDSSAPPFASLDEMATEVAKGNIKFITHSKSSAYYRDIMTHNSETMQRMREVCECSVLRCRLLFSHECDTGACIRISGNDH